MHANKRNEIDEVYAGDILSLIHISMVAPGGAISKAFDETDLKNK